MSRESMEWLNTMTLQGFTSKRGHAWHYLESEQGAEPNHYPDAIPAADVQRRLFGWEPVVARVKVSGRAGGQSFTIVDEDRKAIVHPDTHEILGVVGKDYKVHGYQQWLVDNTKDILDAPELGIGSAGLLRKGAVAWVQIDMAETVQGPGGIEHRPYFLATTSLDGQMSTLYKPGTRLVVCDNTRDYAMRETGEQVKVRHRSRSLGQLTTIRERLGLLYQVTDEVNAELDELLNTPVSDRQWEQFVAAHIGRERPAEAGAGQTRWDNTHDQIDTIYRSDERAAPWQGTSFGALNAVSTFDQHERTTKGMSSPERHMTNVVSGTWDKEDARALRQLNLILAA
jgi:phage/plasmid-like protein (TIGR03299 family)